MFFRILFVTMLLLCNTFDVLAKDLRVAYPNISNSLDPYEQLSLETLRTNTMVFDPLLRITTGADYEPRLATKWKIIDENTTRFYLRNDVYFHSGKKLNVDDIIFTFQRVRESPEFKGVFSPIKDIKAVDDITFDMITKRSFPLTLNIASVFFPMDSEFYAGKNAAFAPKDQVVARAKTYAAHNTSGTGAFTIESFSDGQIVFLKNKEYWDKQASNIEKVTLQRVADEVSRVEKLLDAELDIINPIGIKGVEKIRNSKQLKIVSLPGETLLTYLINLERSEGLKNKKIRQAINYAIDRKKIIHKTLKDLATPAEQFSPPMYAGHNSSLTKRYDPKKAMQLIKESGFKGALEFDMIAPDYRDEEISQTVVSMLAEVGIKVNLKILPEDTYWDVVDDSGADIMMVGWYSDTKDSNNFFEFLAACSDEKSGRGKYNSGKYCNPEVDQLIQEANVIMKPSKRAKILQKIEKILYDDAMHLPLLWEDVVWATKTHVPLKNIINGIDVPYFGDLILDEK